MAEHEPRQYISMLYHANLNHFSLSGAQRDAYARSYMAELVGSIAIPSALSLPLEDLMYLYLYYPETYRDITSNPHITFLLSTYAHVITGFDFGSYVDQMALGRQVRDRFVPKKRRSAVAYPSELQIPPSYTWMLGSTVWDSLVLGDTRVKVKGNADSFFFKPAQKHLAHAVISKRRSWYRPAFHMYLREQLPVEGVLGALNVDAKKMSDKVDSISRIDLEAPVFNEVLFPDGRNTGPRIDLWHKLQAAYARQRKNFVSIDEVFRRAGEFAPRLRDVKPDHQEDKKWTYIKHIPAIQTARTHITPSSPEWYTWLSTHHSDYFCTEGPDWVYGAHGGGNIRIVKRQVYREPELLGKLSYLQNNLATIRDEAIYEYVQRIVGIGQFLRQYELQADQRTHSLA